MSVIGSRILCASIIIRTTRIFCRYVSKKAKLKRYTDTVNLPQTSFKLSMKGGASCGREIEIQKICGFPALYEWQQAQKGEQEFVLHDGPPYANGNPHVGHALNKILKDVTNRYKLLQGYKVHYIPGWDCHGMPIEQKALTEMKVSDHRTLSPLEIRSKARYFATKVIKKQMKAFQRWGVMADWSKQCYFTYDKQFVANELDVFYDMYKKGFIYQDYMPVYWSPSSGSALAEAELEYNEQHQSTAVYVKFPVRHLPANLKGQLGSSDVYVTVWTTTPWTLPANRAICYGDNIEYSFIKEEESGDILLLCTDFCTKLVDFLGKEFSTILTVKGSDLIGMSYSHPLLDNAELPMLQASHVTVGKGTGLVHTAPAHGPEDFQVAVKYNLPIDCYVNEQGEFTSQMGQILCGKEVLGDGTKAVLDMLKDNILHKEVFTHSYPYDWRTKQPVILRACKQWFVNTSRIKDKALEILSDVEIFPRWSSKGMMSQLEMRTYWCISRQRVWGVPIPVFYEKNTGKVLITRESVSHVKDLVKQHGSDCWWSLPVEELLPKEIVEKSGFPPSSEFVRGMDVLDIWFDSGTSWSSVLKGNEKRSDVYLEGLDQFGGWFQSSLLTSVAAQGHAPYKSIVVHGFAVDDDGKKMSKSLGNVVDPDLVINGGKDKEAQPAYGADVLRWWAAHSGLDTKVTIGPQTLNMCNEQLFKMRKSLRYLMGNLCDYSSDRAVSLMDMEIQDRYMLHLLHHFLSQVTEAYEDFNFTRVTQLTEKFINSQVSGFYCHITKDRMYCDHKDSVGRRSCQTVQYNILEALVKVIAPVVPHLAEEIYMHHPFKGVTDSVFKTSWFHPDDMWINSELARIMDTIFSIRDTFNESIAATNPLNYDLVLAAKWNLFQDIKFLQPDNMTAAQSGLTEVFGCSSCSVIARPPLVIPDEAVVVEGHLMHVKSDGFQKERKYVMIILPAENHICERCRRYTSSKYGQPCDRCTEVMSIGWE